MELEATSLWGCVRRGGRCFDFEVCFFPLLLSAILVTDAILVFQRVLSNAFPICQGCLGGHRLSLISPAGSPVFVMGVLAYRQSGQSPVEVTVVFRDILNTFNKHSIKATADPRPMNS